MSQKRFLLVLFLCFFCVFKSQSPPISSPSIGKRIIGSERILIESQISTGPADQSSPPPSDDASKADAAQTSNALQNDSSVQSNELNRSSLESTNASSATDPSSTQPSLDENQQIALGVGLSIGVVSFAGAVGLGAALLYNKKKTPTRAPYSTTDDKSNAKRTTVGAQLRQQFHPQAKIGLRKYPSSFMERPRITRDPSRYKQAHKHQFHDSFFENRYIPPLQAQSLRKEGADGLGWQRPKDIKKQPLQPPFDPLIQTGDQNPIVTRPPSFTLPVFMEPVRISQEQLQKNYQQSHGKRLLPNKKGRPKEGKKPKKQRVNVIGADQDFGYPQNKEWINKPSAMSSLNPLDDSIGHIPSPKPRQPSSKSSYQRWIEQGSKSSMSAHASQNLGRQNLSKESRQQMPESTLEPKEEPYECDVPPEPSKKYIEQFDNLRRAMLRKQAQPCRGGEGCN